MSPLHTSTMTGGLPRMQSHGLPRSCSALVAIDDYHVIHGAIVARMTAPPMTWALNIVWRDAVALSCRPWRQLPR